EVCGSLTNCDAAFGDNTVIGTDSLVTYKQRDKIIVDGLMDFGVLKSSDSRDANGKYKLERNGYYDWTKSEWTAVDTATQRRIDAAIQAVENQVNQKLDALATDPTIDMCIKGRSKRWNRNQDSYDAADSREIARFPNLLDSYSKMIFSAGLEKAYLNYHDKYNEMIGKALEEQDDDIKAATCAAMAYQEGAPICREYNTGTATPTCKRWAAAPTLQSIFGSSGDTGLKNNGTRYQILGADLSKKLKVLSSAKGEFIQTDGQGNMMGSITTIATYSPGTNICTVKTTTTMCKDVETIITTDTDDCGGGGVVGIGGGCGQGGIQVLGGYGHTTTTQNYKGTYCSSYGDPVETVTEIKM
ncbi:MAG: hypothetical protein J5613_04305, partial [Alphaproteobacteria bacterium]|nr:hypothetical protein [Alphaproteobacteria bacterium]